MFRFMNADILAFGAHPDDTELGCGGTLAKLARNGKNVVVIDLTRGEKGSRGTPETREKEAARAAEILGLRARENLGLPDSELDNTRRFQLPVIERVRAWRPRICIVGADSDRHPDHGNATRLLVDAIFFSGLRKIATKDGEGRLQEPHRPAHLLHYMQDRPFEPDLVFDISETLEIKEQALRAFSTQFDVRDPGDEPHTYISDPEFFETVRARARHYGHLAGFRHGEPFRYAGGAVPLTSFDLFDRSSPKR